MCGGGGDGGDSGSDESSNWKLLLPAPRLQPFLPAFPAESEGLIVTDSALTGWGWGEGGRGAWKRVSNIRLIGEKVKK